jgi:hypothetical protein
MRPRPLFAPNSRFYLGLSGTRSDFYEVVATSVSDIPRVTVR